MKHTLIIIGLLFLIGNISFAQKQSNSQTIRGTVKDADTQMPVEGVNVILQQNGKQEVTLTNTDGEFKFLNVPVGRQGLTAYLIGYNPVNMQNVSVESGRQTVLDLKMKISIIETEEVVIIGKKGGKRINNEMASVSARTFSVENTEKYAGSLGDPSRMAANFAGVMSVSDQRNDIVIRGNSPAGLLWRLEGIEIPNPNHFGAMGSTGGPVSMLNNNLLSNSDFYTGAFPAEYGNALSGVFDLNMRNGNNQEREYVGQVGFSGFELGAEGPFSKKSKASYLANIRYSTLELFNKMGFDMGTGASVPQYKDLTYHLNFPLKNGRISIIGLGGISYIELLDEQTDASYGVKGTNTYYGSDMAVSGISHVHFFSDKSQLHTTLSGQYSRNYTILDSLNENETYPYYRSDFTEYKYSLSSKFKHRFNKKNIFVIGVTADHFVANFADSVKRTPNESVLTTITNHEGNFQLQQAFSEWKHHFNNKFSFYTGVHFTDFLLNNSTAFEPRIGFNWVLKQGQSLNAGIGMHSQLQPHLTYFAETHQADGTIRNSNKDLGLTKSNQAVLGYSIMPGKNFRVKLETYYQQLYDIPVGEENEWFSMLNQGAYFSNLALDSMVNEGTGENYGIELTIEKFFESNYYFLLTSTLYESKYKGFDGIERNTVFNGNYVFNALGGYEIKTGANSVVSLDLRTVLAGGQRIMPVDLEESILQKREVYDTDNAFKERYDDYIKLDVRISFKLNWKNISQEWALDFQNVTNNKNVFRQFYNPTTETIQTDYQSGIYPMMLYRIRF